MARPKRKLSYWVLGPAWMLGPYGESASNTRHVAKVCKTMKEAHRYATRLRLWFEQCEVEIDSIVVVRMGRGRITFNAKPYFLCPTIGGVEMCRWEI
jgi:hypothetical protein